MKKKSIPEALIKSTDTSPSSSPQSKLDEVTYPEPSDGIAMQIDELKENLASIQEQTSVDPNFLPVIDQQE